MRTLPLIVTASSCLPPTSCETRLWDTPSNCAAFFSVNSYFMFRVSSKIIGIAIESNSNILRVDTQGRGALRRVTSRCGARAAKWQECTAVANERRGGVSRPGQTSAVGRSTLENPFLPQAKKLAVRGGTRAAEIDRRRIHRSLRLFGEALARFSCRSLRRRRLGGPRGSIIRASSTMIHKEGL